jgi:hypothetical protein
VAQLKGEPSTVEEDMERDEKCWYAQGHKLDQMLGEREVCSALRAGTSSFLLRGSHLFSCEFSLYQSSVAIFLPLPGMGSF